MSTYKFIFLSWSLRFVSIVNKIIRFLSNLCFECILYLEFYIFLFYIFNSIYFSFYVIDSINFYFFIYQFYNFLLLYNFFKLKFLYIYHSIFFKFYIMIHSQVKNISNNKIWENGAMELVGLSRYEMLKL